MKKFTKLPQGNLSPQIRQLLDINDFEVTMNELELVACHAFRDVCK